MKATYGPMHVDMTIENGKVTSLKYHYTASVNPLALKVLITINGTGTLEVDASYTNFQY
jgi:proline racemase